MIRTDILNYFNIDVDYFDFGFNFEFPEKDSLKYNRGGREYIRPCGWYRFGLKISGKYDNGNDDWLGESNCSGEWVNAYHGTKIKNVKDILEEGLKPGNRNAYGVGIYCSPKIEIASRYATPFEYEKELYKVVIQVRVKPDKIIDCKTKGGKEDYWYIEKSENIRNFAVLMKNKNKESSSLQKNPIIHNHIEIHKKSNSNNQNSIGRKISTTRNTLKKTSPLKTPPITKLPPIPNQLKMNITQPITIPLQIPKKQPSLQLSATSNPTPLLSQRIPNQSTTKVNQSEQSIPSPPQNPQNLPHLPKFLIPLTKTNTSPKTVSTITRCPSSTTSTLSNTTTTTSIASHPIVNKSILSPLQIQQINPPKPSSSSFSSSTKSQLPRSASTPPPPKIAFVYKTSSQPTTSTSTYSESNTIKQNKSKIVNKYKYCGYFEISKYKSCCIDCIRNILSFLLLSVFISILSMRFVNYLDYESILLQKYGIISMFSVLSLSIECLEIFINCFKVESLNYIGYKVYSSIICVYYILISIYTLINDISLPFYCLIMTGIIHLFGCCWKMIKEEGDELNNVQILHKKKGVMI